MTARELVRHVRSMLVCDEADITAKLIVAAALDTDKNALLSISQRVVTEDEARRACDMAIRRNEGEPIQYILGCVEFYSLPFEVGKGVLIPRADTETLVDEALDFIDKTGAKRVVDLCSGSGCVAVAIGKNAPNVQVDAVEYYDDAYRFLVRNIGLNSCYNVNAIKDDARVFQGQYDLVVSNPPYVNKALIPTLSKEVLREPETALFAEDEGLIFYKIIAKNFSAATRCIMFEHGEEQGAAVREILQQNGFENIRSVRDLSGNERVSIGYGLNR